MKKIKLLLIIVCTTHVIYGFETPGHFVIETKAYELLNSTNEGKLIYQYLIDKKILKKGSKSSYPDMDLGRQFLSERQIYHFMASYKFVLEAIRKDSTLADKQRRILKRALPDCVAAIYIFFREIVDNDIGADQTGRGLYVLMHIIADSYSREHTKRDEQTNELITIKSWQWSKIKWPRTAMDSDNVLKGEAHTLGLLHSRKALADKEYIDHLRSTDRDTVLTRNAQDAAKAIEALLIAIYDARHNPEKTDHIIQKYIETYFKPYNSEILDREFFLKDDSTKIQISYKQLYDTNGQASLKFDYYMSWSMSGIYQFGFADYRDNAIGIEIGRYYTPFRSSVKGALFRRLPFGPSFSLTKNNMAHQEIGSSFQNSLQAQLTLGICIFAPWRDLMIEPKMGYGATPFNMGNLHHAFIAGAEVSGSVGEHLRLGLGWEYDTSRLPALNTLQIKVGFNTWQFRKIIKQKTN